MKTFKLVFIMLSSLFCFSSFTVFADDESSVLVPYPAIPVMGKTFYTVRPDFRECVSPICGGWFVKAVNLNAIPCPDGSIKKECYVGSDKIKIPGLSDRQMAELRQAMHESRALLVGAISSRIKQGLLVIRGAWISATPQAAEGTFVGVRSNGIVCITYPCPSYDGYILNQRYIKSLAAVDLSAVQASDEQLMQAQAAIDSDDGLPLAGHFVEVTGPAGSAQGIAASQFYLKVESEKPKACMATGCSGQICSDTEVMTTCEWLPEYACYRTATCALQENGDCGWVMDEELQRCLENTVTHFPVAVE